MLKSAAVDPFRTFGAGMKSRLLDPPFPEWRLSPFGYGRTAARPVAEPHCRITPRAAQQLRALSVVREAGQVGRVGTPIFRGAMEKGRLR
jgi:hypothetical protein